MFIVLLLLVCVTNAVPHWKKAGSDPQPVKSSQSEKTLDLLGTGTCPLGTLYFAKYDWHGPDYQFTGGIGGEPSLTIIAGNSTWGQWESHGWTVATMYVKRMNVEVQTDYNPDIVAGTFSNDGLGGDVQYVRFCGNLILLPTNPTTTTTTTTKSTTTTTTTPTTTTTTTTPTTTTTTTTPTTTTTTTTPTTTTTTTTPTTTTTTTTPTTTTTTTTMTTTKPTTTTPHSCGGNCPHTINITINDYNTLDVEVHDGGSVFEFCQTSTYMGPHSSVVIGFDPYVPCELNQRGSCDNKHVVHFSSETSCAEDPEAGEGLCDGGGHGVSFKIAGLSNNLSWDDSVVQAVFVEDEDTGSAHLFGYLKDDTNPQIELYVNIWFNNLYAPHTIPLGSPVIPLLPTCYLGDTAPLFWSYYHDITGTIIATPGSDYDGLILSVTRYGPAPQVGYGANGENLNAGLRAGFSWSVVHQPYEISLEVSSSHVCSYITLDLTSDCTDNHEYCSLFGEPDAGAANGWVATLNESASLITYCANFTIEELLSCRSFSDHYKSLFTVKETTECEDCVIDYIGQLYQTTVLPDHCESWESDSCGDMTVLSACYNITLELDAGGSVEISFLVSDIDFWLHWLHNVWLCGDDAGNLKVVLRTRVCQGGDDDIHLCHPSVDTESETGYPIVFVAPLDPECDITDDSCYQIWNLQTFGASDVIDFSGFKLLKWDVCKGNMVIGHVSANLDLHAKHMGEQIHLDGKVDAAVTLYTDPEFETEYHCTPLTDCEFLYGKLCLTNYDHLDAEIRKAYICFSQTRDLIPYDPLHPESTGCNTPGDDVIKVLIYSTNLWESDEIDLSLHNFEIIELPSSENECEAFDFRLLAYTKYKQSLRIVWCAHETGGFGGLVESISEYQMNDGSFSHIRKDHQEEDHDFLVHCPDDWFFDWTAHRCHDHHHSFDDDDNVGNGTGIFISILVLLLICCIFFCCFQQQHVVVSPPYLPQQAPQQQQQQQHVNVYTTNQPSAYASNNNSNFNNISTPPPPRDYSNMTFSIPENEYSSLPYKKND